MAFVKLDCGILHSTLWHQRPARELFVTALLMARPHELTEAAPQLEVRSLDPTGWHVPPGWYGLIEASGAGIAHQAVVDQEAALTALEQMGRPEPESRSQAFEGRRMVRIDGGYIVLNFAKYRQKDHTTAQRSAKYRKRKERLAKPTRRHTVTARGATQAEAYTHETERPSTEEEIREVERRYPKPSLRLTPEQEREKDALEVGDEAP